MCTSLLQFLHFLHPISLFHARVKSAASYRTTYGWRLLIDEWLTGDWRCAGRVTRVTWVARARLWRCDFDDASRTVGCCQQTDCRPLTRTTSRRTSSPLNSQQPPVLPLSFFVRHRPHDQLLTNRHHHHHHHHRQQHQLPGTVVNWGLR